MTSEQRARSTREASMRPPAEPNKEKPDVNPDWDPAAMSKETYDWCMAWSAPFRNERRCNAQWD